MPSSIISTDRIGSGPSVRSRLDPATATGLALTAALFAVVVAGTVMGVVVYMVRTNSGRHPHRPERCPMGHRTRERLRLRALRVLTTLGSTHVIIALALACGVYGWRQRHTMSIPLFLALVVGGQALMSTLIKIAVDRVRPDMGPLGLLGTPSFPSGHSTATAATFAALALVLGRNRSPRERAALAGIAVALAVASGGLEGPPGRALVLRRRFGTRARVDVVRHLRRGLRGPARLVRRAGGSCLASRSPSRCESPPVGHGPPRGSLLRFLTREPRQHRFPRHAVAAREPP